MMNASRATRTGIPALPDPRGDEQMFRLRILEAVKELYRRMGAVERSLENGALCAGRPSDVKIIENVQNNMGG